jgi:hypothetical protein
MNRIFAAAMAWLLVLSAAHAGTYTTSLGSWDLYQNTTQLGTYPTQDDCINAAAATNVTGILTCSTTTTVNVTTSTATVEVARSGSLTYSTNFDLTEYPLSEGGKWTNAGLDWTYVKTENGIAHGTMTQSGYNDSYATLAGFPADQSISGVIQNDVAVPFSGNREVELHLRWTDGSHYARGYEITMQHNAQYAYIVRWNGALGDFTILTPLSIPPLPSGTVIKAQIVGDLIQVWIDGQLMGSVRDSTWTDGNPGIGFYAEGGARNDDFGFSSVTAISIP